MNSNDENEINVWIFFSQLKRLKLKKTIFISFDFMINENINKDTQTIINELFFEKLSILKIDSFYVNNLVLIIDDHKIWAHIINTMFQHQTQKSIIYEKYQWIMSFDALFHLKMNMIELLLTNHYDFTKSKTSINRFHLRTHVEFWNRKKIKFDNWDFHVAQKLILQSYKARVTTIFWIFQRQKIHENVDELTNELESLKNWISDVIASSLFQLIEKIRIYLMNFHLFNIQDEKLRNHILYVQQIETYLLLKYVIFRDDIDLFSRMFVWVILLFHESKKFNY